MHLWKNSLFFIGVLVGCLSFSFTPVAHGFIVVSGGLNIDELKILMPHIFKPQWKIGYRYGADCKAEERQNGEALQDAISDSLRVWLAPLKELQPARPIVDKFVYVLQADLNPDLPEDLDDLRAVDLQVTFECTQGTSVASIQFNRPPAVIIRVGTKLTAKLLFHLTHELGHAFGLADTYARGGILQSSGGLKATAGKQPASVMAGNAAHDDELADAPSAISEDDKRGIIWLYRYF